MKKGEDLITLYKLYLFALIEREEYGDKYGDTDEIIKMYEEKLNIKKENNNVNGNTGKTLLLNKRLY